MNEYVSATTVFADEMDVEMLRRIIDCAKNGMTRADTAVELDVHYTALSAVASLLKIEFARTYGPKAEGKYRASEACVLVRKDHRIDKPMRRRTQKRKAKVEQQSRAAGLVKSARALVEMGYGIAEAARMYSLSPEVLKRACADTQAVAS